MATAEGCIGDDHHRPAWQLADAARILLWEATEHAIMAGCRSAELARDRYVPPCLNPAFRHFRRPAARLDCAVITAIARPAGSGY